MRELSLNEVEQVSGGFNWFTGAGEIFSADSIAQASLFSGGLGLLAASWSVGYRAGSWISNSYGSQIDNFVWNTFH